ncbi:hypothetical protein [Sinomicrobium weinanense]|uniref:Uncharacterized protein n=1 Tax=Sinomicrobium weinanense TaxID=2842200 RepID=A0A926Q3C5_9FLAO|nr:hypothetical protein [Sinomicrobium weinanense]MBC9795610.1 hypothetical protein [Sinomicrobium weinanense]MBU3124631.1 hypothetical protein [Sinomicrobium weinanense]
MLLYASCNDIPNKKKIETAVGKPFIIAERVKIGGIHSPKMDIVASSVQLHNLLILNQADSTCTIELRPRGIILKFTAILDRYALVIPYHKLSILKVNTNIYTIYKDDYYLKVDVRNEAGRDFIKKILKSKSDSYPTFIDDL